MGYTFERDPEKADANLQKHAVSFDEASTVFGDPLSLLMPDPDHSADEERYIVLCPPESAVGSLCGAAAEYPADFCTARNASRKEAI